MKNVKILICGFGNIGTHIYNEMFDLVTNTDNHYIYVYDKYKPLYLDRHEYLESSFDFAFICVPTDRNEDDSVDISMVEDAVRDTTSEIIVIKSAIPPGTTEYLSKKYNKRIVISPEFYGTTVHALNEPEFLILGGDRHDCSKVADLYHKFVKSSFKIHYTDYKTAELVKYMENSYLAMKVTFCSEFFHIAKEIGVDYNELRELVTLDPRFGMSHSYIDPEKPFYDSHCLNKDIPGIIKFCKDKTGFQPLLLNMMNTINQIEKKSAKDRM